MVTVSVCCSLPSACMNVMADRASPGPSSSGKTFGSLAWDPLHRSVVLRSSSYLSSSASFVISRNVTPRTTINSRGIIWRALIDVESKQLPVIATGSDPEIVKESGNSKLVKFSATTKEGLSRFFTAAAKPAVVAVLMALLLAQPTDDALAAGGGRVGGKAFSKPSNPGRSYSGGGGGGGRAYSGGMYSAPPIYGSPYGYSPFGFSPFYGGGYGGGLFLGPSIGFGGGGTIILAIIAFATLNAISRFIRDRFDGRDQDDRFDE